MSLNTGLISYWKFEEASAPFADSIGSNPFAAPGSPPSRIPGKVGKGIRFTGDPQHLAIDDNASLATGDTDFFLAIWVYLDSKTNSMAIISKTAGAVGASDEYLLEYDQGTDRFRFSVSDGASVSTVSANNFGSPSTATWYLLMAWHDSVNNEIAIQVNNTTHNTQAHSTGVNNTSIRLILGFTEGGGPSFVYLGRLDEMGIWGRVLSSDERSELYNSGNGRTLPLFEFIADPDKTLSGGLVAYWKLEEPTGSIRYDFMANRNLTDNNTVERIEGKRGHAAHFTAANTEFLTGPSVSDSYLSPGDIDFSIACWVYLDSKTIRRTIVKKGDWNTIIGIEYNLCYDSAADRFRFRVSANGTTATQIDADALGSPSTGTWYFIVCWHDSVGDTINIQINNGSINSAAHSTGVFQGTGTFNLGSGNNGSSELMDGRIEEMGFWNRVLSTSEKTDLYNSGNGNTPKIAMTDISDSSLVSSWRLSETSGTRVDAVGSNDLTDNNTVTQQLGKVTTAAQLTAANSEFLGVATNASLGTGDIDFTIGCWVYLDSKGIDNNIIAKYHAATNNAEYRIAFTTALNRFYFAVSSNGSAITSVTSEVIGNPSTGTWYFILAWHDATHNTINLQINNGVIDSAAHTGGVFNNAVADFRIGARGNTAEGFFDGRIDDAFLTKRKLTPIERTSLFNSSYGRSLPPQHITVDSGEFN